MAALLITGCARRGNIDGGAKDTIPPQLEVSLPENFSTGFKGKEIKLSFDEYVRLKDVGKQLVVSPPLKYQPVITPSAPSKTLTIRLRDTLQENTTYSLNFGQSIQDNNEGIPLSQFRYVFSTGSTIDSLEMSGSIRDALEKQADNFVTVMLYEINETYNDSTIYKEKPRYVTNTLDSAVVFKLQNMKAGKYQLIALKDGNGNYQYNPKSDKLAFHTEPVELPTDKQFVLRLFQEKGAFRGLRPSQASGSRMLAPYEGDPEGAAYTVSNGTETFPSTVTKFPDKDSLQLWLRAPKADSLNVRIEKDGFRKDFWVKLKNQKKDSIAFSPEFSGVLHPRQVFNLRSHTPLAKFDESRISVRDKDSTAIPFTLGYDAFNQKLEVRFEKQEDQKYRIDMLPGALTDFFDQANDTLGYRVSTRLSAEYGNLRLKLSNAKSYPVIVELTDDKGKILATEYADGPKDVEFIGVEPADFTIRLIYDTNANRIWDPGSWNEKRQPEEVIYFPATLKVRTNWDVTEEWNLGG